MTTDQKQQLAPVTTPRDVTRPLVSLDELSDDVLMSLFETQKAMSRWFYFGALGGVAAFSIAFWYFGLSGRSLWSYSFFVCAGFAALGSRAYLRGEAARMGLSRDGLNEYHRRQRKLQWGNLADGRRRAKELNAVPRNERLALYLKHFREIDPAS